MKKRAKCIDSELETLIHEKEAIKMSLAENDARLKEEEDEARGFNNDIRRIFESDDEEEEEGNSSKSFDDVRVELSNKPEEPKSDKNPNMQR